MKGIVCQSLQNTAEVLQKFVLTLALCHSVIPETVGGHLVYHASSPDEEALVKAAKEVGVVLKGRLPEAVIVEVVSEI
jgi:magnesium-transporting ATPase (P-type)